MLDIKKIRSEYETKGYAILRNVIDKGLLAEANEHIKWLGNKYPDLRPEHYHHPLMRDDAFWVRLVTDRRLLDIAEVILGADLARFTAHYICKPPHTGQPVFWHQDGAYWKLAPMEALTVWLAVDESTPENGCLRIIPGSHNIPLDVPELRTDSPNMLYSSIRQELVDEWIRRAGVVDIILQPGDVSIHHPKIIHCSEPNHSHKRRCGLDMGFIRTSTSISNSGLYLDPLLVRGKAIPEINNYRHWPEFHPIESIPFRGHQQWNEDIKARNFGLDRPARPESPIELTLRMIDRLKSGTVKQ
ncbi:MAG: phytanoyl-CoA dioxygenase family protein [Betaproteobacteria bacterium]|nr:phytanoyl-CoA dioxygenase family protein [Betaproteobacteria bacterium]